MGSASPALLWAVVASGLASYLFGIGLFGREIYFLAGSKKITALKMFDPKRGTVLKIRDGSRIMYFPAHSEDNHALGAWNVLYNPNLNTARYPSESDARLLGGPFFATLGCLFILVALVGLRNLRAATPAADWTDRAFLLAGTATLGAIVCSVIALIEVKWKLGFYMWVFVLFMSGLSIAALAAITHGICRCGFKTCLRQ